MKQRSLRLMVAESELDDIFLLQEALSEMTEARYWRVWMRELRPVFVDRMDDALRLLREEPFDAILLSLSLPDCQGLHTFMRIHAEAPATPVVVLAGDGEEVLAASAVREGAQDYLVKSELDCMPLARALRHAIERQRMCESLRRLAYVDELTGLLNYCGFLALSEHDLRIAAKLEQHLAMLVVDVRGVEVDGPPESPRRMQRQNRDVAMIEMGDVLRAAFDTSAVVARLGGDRFGVVAVDSGEAPPLEGQFMAKLREHNTRRARRCRLQVATGYAQLFSARGVTVEQLLQSAESSLCENKRGMIAPISAVEDLYAE